MGERGRSRGCQPTPSQQEARSGCRVSQCWTKATKGRHRCQNQSLATPGLDDKRLAGLRSVLPPSGLEEAYSIAIYVAKLNLASCLRLVFARPPLFAYCDFGDQGDPHTSTGRKLADETTVPHPNPHLVICTGPGAKSGTASITDGRAAEGPTSKKMLAGATVASPAC